MSSRYFEHDGRRWCWNIEPTFRCPNAGLTEYVPAPDGEGDGHRVIVRREDEVTEAAQALGMDPLKLAQLVTRGHNSHAHGRERVAGKLTDRCQACGAKMIREGFRAWAERFIPEDERNSSEAASAHINRRLLGGDGRAWRTEGVRWYDTKKEAKTWALEELKTARAVAA